jgi:hypothetical protein
MRLNDLYIHLGAAYSLKAVIGGACATRVYRTAGGCLRWLCGAHRGMIDLNAHLGIHRRTGRTIGHTHKEDG